MYINISVLFIMGRKKKKHSLFSLSLQCNFNSEVPLLEDSTLYRQLRGTRGNFWRVTAEESCFRDKMPIQYFLLKKSLNCISSFSSCVQNAGLICIHCSDLKD